MTRSVDINLHLFLGNSEHVSNVFVTLSLKISQLHTASLFLG